MYAAGEIGEHGPDVTICRPDVTILHAKSAECKLPLQIGVTWTRLLCTYMACELYNLYL